jgi:homoserine dehydrogenase
MDLIQNISWLLLIKHAFGLIVEPQKVFNCGIRNLKPQDVKYASEKGYRIKLFSRAEKLDQQVLGFVAPHFVKQDHFAYQVDNEFNAVVVEALFSDKQLFIGKGAGSFPTASAVLSDISALQFDYRYEYRKTDDQSTAEFSEDFFLKIYVGSEFIEAINEIPFARIDEVYQSGGYNYQTGWVNFNDLREFDLNQRPDLSVIVLPDSFVSVKDSEKLHSESIQYLTEFEI